MALIHDVMFDSQTRVLSLLDKAGNVISSCEVPSKEELVDDPSKPLMLRAIADNSSVTLQKYGTLSNTYQTSTDGTNWTNYTLGTKILLNNGDSVYFRCRNHPTTQSSKNYVQFVMEGKIEAWHNAYSMISSDFSSAEGSVGDYGMYSLFDSCASLTKAPLLVNALSGNCYKFMFFGCTSLTSAPQLPATTLANSCYSCMFYGCSNLKEVRIAATKTATDALYDWLYGVSATGDFYCNPNATIFPTDSASGIPKGWTRIPKPAPTVDDPNKPLMLRAIEDNSSVTLRNIGTLSNTYQTSTNGTDWTDYTLGTKISLNNGEYVYFRCSNHPTTQNSTNYAQFVMTGKIEAWHNAYSMISSSFTNTGASVGNYGMCGLFRGCVSLTKAPLLLNTLADNCYNSMFRGCTSLTSAPQLPATTLAKSCYYSMFSDCTSLTSAPQLPATTLAESCYYYMFRGCTSLTSAPQLPATTLAQYCYETMFSGCSKLKEIRISAITTAEGAFTGWLANVSATGDFYCDPNATIFPTDSVSGIPSGWTRHALADYPVTP